MLAANPDHANDRWKALPLQTQFAVAVYMARFYGTAFARQFAALHDAAKLPRRALSRWDRIPPRRS